MSLPDDHIQYSDSRSQYGVEKRSNSDDVTITVSQDRTSRPIDMLFAFAGVNLAVTNLASGALGITLGLSLLDVLLVYLIAGAMGAVVIGLCVVQAKATGASVMVNSRPVFGYYGTRWITVILFLITACWFSVNSFFGVTAARSIVSGLGGPQSHALDLILLLLTNVVMIVVAVFGYRSIIRYERLTVLVMGVAVLALLTGAVTKGINWSYPGALTGSERTSGIITLVTALGVGWAVSWTPYAHDFARHVKKTGSNKAAFTWGWAGMFLGSFLTFGLSAAIAATARAEFDVGLTVNAVLPSSIAVIVLVFMIIGLLPANLANLLIGPALLRTLDIKVNRTVAVIATAVVGSPISIIGLFQPSFGSIFQSWMLTLGIWLGPWVTISMLDFYVIHRSRYSEDDLLSPSEGTGGGHFMPGIISWLTGVVCAFLFVSSDVLTSPLAKILNNANASLFIGSVAAGVLYYPLARRRKRG